MLAAIVLILLVALTAWLMFLTARVWYDAGYSNGHLDGRAERAHTACTCDPAALFHAPDCPHTEAWARSRRL